LFDNSECASLRFVHTDAGDGHTGTAFDMGFEHLPRIESINVIGAEDDDVFWILIVKKIHVLKKCVSRSGEPTWPLTHLSGHGGDIVAQNR